MSKVHSQQKIQSPVALVTGAGRRVGNGIARALAARGYRVALHANSSLVDAQRSADELTAGGGQAIALAADLRDQAATRDMIARVRADNVREHFEINTLGTFICCQQAGLIMAGQPQGGAIVNIGDWAIQRPYLDHAAYFASKGSIPALTRAFAVELAARNPRVRVNAVLPGPVLLPEGMSAHERRQVTDATLVKREGTVDELTAAIVLLLENEFITGVCLPVDGGRTICSPTTDD